jgi:type I restriction enzyme S subunit
MELKTFYNNFEVMAEAPNGVEKLREMILQMAVQGKLVPQDQKDEPASVLMDRITAEKKRLINEKVLRKSKPLPAIKGQECPYQIPRFWIWMRLGDVGRIVGGGTPKTGRDDYFADKGIPWLTPADLYQLNNKYISKGRRDISELGLKKSSATLMPKGTVLFSSRAPIGYLAIAMNEICTNQGFKSCVPFIMEMNEYIYYFLKNAGPEIDRKAPGTTFREVSGKLVSEILVPVPPLAEQKRIVAKVDELMALCDDLEVHKQNTHQACIQLNDTSIDKLLTATTPAKFSRHWQRIADNFDLLYGKPKNVTKLRQAILQLAVQGKLVKQDPKDEPASRLLGKIRAEKGALIESKTIRKPKLDLDQGDLLSMPCPSGWAMAFLQDITSVITCGIASTPKYIDKGKIFLSAKNVKPYKFKPDDHKFVDQNTYEKIVSWGAKPEFNDILLTRVGAGIGEAALIDRDIDFAYYVSLTLIKPIQRYIFPKYLLHWLNSPEGTQRAIENIYGRGVSQGNLNVNQVRKFIVPIPPLGEQERIASKVDQLMALCDDLEAKLIKGQAKSGKLMEAAVADLLAA